MSSVSLCCLPCPSPPLSLTFSNPDNDSPNLKSKNCFLIAPPNLRDVLLVTVHPGIALKNRQNAKSRQTGKRSRKKSVCGANLRFSAILFALIRDCLRLWRFSAKAPCCAHCAHNCAQRQQPCVHPFQRIHINISLLPCVAPLHNPEMHCW